MVRNSEEAIPWLECWAAESRAVTLKAGPAVRSLWSTDRKEAWVTAAAKTGGGEEEMYTHTHTRVSKDTQQVNRWTHTHTHTVKWENTVAIRINLVERKIISCQSHFTNDQLEEVGRLNNERTRMSGSHGKNSKRTTADDSCVPGYQQENGPQIRDGQTPTWLSALYGNLPSREIEPWHYVQALASGSQLEHTLVSLALVRHSGLHDPHYKSQSKTAASTGNWSLVSTIETQ